MNSRAKNRFRVYDGDKARRVMTGTSYRPCGTNPAWPGTTNVVYRSVPIIFGDAVEVNERSAHDYGKR